MIEDRGYEDESKNVHEQVDLYKERYHSLMPQEQTTRPSPQSWPCESPEAWSNRAMLSVSKALKCLPMHL